MRSLCGFYILNKTSYQLGAHYYYYYYAAGCHFLFPSCNVVAMS